jgi:hypothetical protein
VSEWPLPAFIRSLQLLPVDERHRLLLAFETITSAHLARNKPSTRSIYDRLFKVVRAVLSGSYPPNGQKDVDRLFEMVDLVKKVSMLETHDSLKKQSVQKAIDKRARIPIALFLSEIEAMDPRLADKERGKRLAQKYGGRAETHERRIRDLRLKQKL